MSLSSRKFCSFRNLGDIIPQTEREMCFRTMDWLMRHLYRMSLQSERTGMTSKNLAIVWSPNILRCDVSELDTQDALQVRHKHLIISRSVIGQFTPILSSHWLIGISHLLLKSVITITSKYFLFGLALCTHCFQGK